MVSTPSPGFIGIIRRHYKIPAHIPVEQIDDYIAIKTEQDLAGFLKRAFDEDKNYCEEKYG